MFVVLLLAALIASAMAASDPLVAVTSAGVFQGHTNYQGMREWKGIPYAKPPSGALRFEYPVKPEPMTTVYEANVDVAGCSQICNLPPGNCPLTTSEDCLYLTIMAPKEPSADPAGYPVFFWIHGGAFEQGLGNCALYNGTTFASQGVVTVVINYRLGALGFMASASMKGNYGIMDQRLAMQWTQDNIAAFGGNPKRVTIGGQSAGAMSVGSHAIAPGSQGLFAQAIMESNPLGMPYHTRESAGANAKSVFTWVGCAEDDVACMKTKTVDEILDAQNHAIKLNPKTLFINFLPFAPMVEVGGELPEQPFDAMAAGHLSEVPMMAGSMYNEGLLFVYELFTAPMTKMAYAATVDAVFGVHAKTIKDLYPFDTNGNTDGRDTFDVLATDLLFYCPLRNMTRGYLAAGKKIPTYNYRFKHILSFDAWGPSYEFCVGVVCHGSELPFVFNVFTDGVSLYYTPTADEVTLTTDLGSAWTNFIATANPNYVAGTKGTYPIPQTYPLYTTASDELVVLDEPGSFNDANIRDSFCDMWDSIGYFW